LLEFTKVHFEEEERTMRKCEYPSLGDHASSHGRLLAEALSLAQAYGAGDLPVAKLTVARLRESLENHIQGEDATFEAWCHRAGIVLE
jgi:hemerythrin-like metal-binding protein